MTRSHTLRTLDDRHGGVRRFTAALIRGIADEGDPADLARLTELLAMLADGLGECVRAMRDHGHTDAAIAEALGVTRQSVSKRWPGGGRYVGAAGRYRS